MFNPIELRKANLHRALVLLSAIGLTDQFENEKKDNDQKIIQIESVIDLRCRPRDPNPRVNR